MHGYVCRVCGQYHEGLPLSYGTDAPAAWYAIPDRQRRRRTRLSSDHCVIDNQYYFIVGNIDIPILEADEVFRWSVWVSLSEQNFRRASELWYQAGRESEPPYFGWLDTSLPGYPETRGLKTHVHTQPVGQRPLIELEPTDHPLAVEQRNGITWDRVQELAEIVLHGSSHRAT